MEPDFEAVHNIDEYATETVSTMRDALKVNNPSPVIDINLCQNKKIILSNYIEFCPIDNFIADLEHDGTILASCQRLSAPPRSIQRTEKLSSDGSFICLAWGISRYVE